MSDDDEFRRVPEIERAANKPTYLDMDAAAVGEIGRRGDFRRAHGGRARRAGSNPAGRAA